MKLIAALALLGSLLSAKPAHASQCPDQIMTLGDSITHSVVLPSSWPGDLSAMTGTPVDNRAVTGWTTNLVLQQLAGSGPFGVHIRQGETVLVLVGVNDMMLYGIAPETVANQDIMISNQIRSLGGIPEILTMTGVGFLPVDEDRFRLLQSRIDTVNGLLRSYAAHGYITLLETGLPNDPIYYDPRETSGDRWLHPNPDGNRVIAQHIASQVCS